MLTNRGNRMIMTVTKIISQMVGWRRMMLKVLLRVLDFATLYASHRLSGIMQMEKIAQPVR